MKKSTMLLSLFLVSFGLLLPKYCLAIEKSPNNSKKTATEATTRNDAVIFKIHDINPISTEGVVTGCDFVVTLYNRSSLNFRNFTLNLKWSDVVDENFHFDRYVETVLGKDEAQKQFDTLGDSDSSKPIETSITVNAFGANKQVSLTSHLDSEKCYLLLRDANYSVTPCDIVRNTDITGNFGVGADNKECTGLFQFVSTSNPEYFGKFKEISATEVAKQNKKNENKELSDIDVVINKIVENLGVSDKTLTDIN